MWLPCSDVVSVNRSSSTPPAVFSASFFSVSLFTAFTSFLEADSVLLDFMDLDFCSFSLPCFVFCPSCFILEAGNALIPVCPSGFPAAFVPSSDAFAPSWDWTAGFMAGGVRGVEGVRSCSSGGAIVYTNNKYM